MTISRLIARSILSSIACAAALGQVDTGTISGIVTDSSGAIVPAAQVTLTQQETNVRMTLPTNEAGFYSSPGLRPGHYDVAVTKAGFQAQRKTGIELRVQDRLEVNFTLSIGATSTEITVAAAAPLLESETSSLGQVIQEKTVTDLPLNGRSFIQLATLTAGTLPSTRTQERDNFVSNGARAVQNSYLLDGIDNKNRILGFDKNSAQIVQPVIDGIEEFKVQTATFSAEFGQAAGGVVNVTMKSGTNRFHGNIFEFLRNSKLDATPYFQPVRNLSAEKGSSNFDVRHRFVMSGFYQSPFGRSGGFVSNLIRNWQISGIFSAQTAQPFTATLSTDPSGTSTTARPNRIADGNLPSETRSRTHWFDTTAFAVPNCICFGNSGRDILRGPGFMNLDLGVIRDFPFHERFRLQFRAESFNMMNHPNFGLPNSSIGNPAVGIITTTINPERQNQLALKFYF